ncbi:protein dd3-3-like [Plakobranchus ocellatus]|uniref:Protein dd3-3-like n=1 Tax=Plakobranchus ocellatus TaxID=259542 RepID=A0AAV4A599_9GAST|nr:protein dd3-3-like [Plakobranchus ocellatus]
MDEDYNYYMHCSTRSRNIGLFAADQMSERDGRKDLEELVSIDDTGKSRKPEWRRFPSHDVPPPECREMKWINDNHLGNTFGGHLPMFNWTIPNHIQHENCVIRIRYHISTSDYALWNTNPSHSAHPRNVGAGSKISLASSPRKARGFIVKTNPVVKLFDGVDLDLRLAGQFRGEVSELDDAGTYFNLPPRKVTQQGTYHYMSTRNNNFSNRDQKGQEGDGYARDFYLVTPRTWSGRTNQAKPLPLRCESQILRVSRYIIPHLTLLTGLEQMRTSEMEWRECKLNAVAFL